MEESGDDIYFAMVLRIHARDLHRRDSASLGAREEVVKRRDALSSRLLGSSLHLVNPSRSIPTALRLYGTRRKSRLARRE